MTVPTPGSPTLDPALRGDIERWFARRGVPQLIEGYRSEPAMDSRAAPLIAAWLVIGTIRDWGTRPDWPLTSNLLGIVATIGWMAIAWTVVSRIRGRPVLTMPRTVDMVDIATVAFLPALPAALIDGTVREAVTAVLGALTGIGVIYVIIGFGLIEIGAWAIERLWLELTHIVELVARTLPVLLILVVFLLFAAEIWEAAHAMSGVELGLVLLLMLIVGALLVVTTFRGELGRIESRSDVAGVLADASDTPAQPLIDRSRGDVVGSNPLTWLERSNLTLLVAVPQLLQAVAVGVVVMGFLVLFALIAIPASVQEAWIGEPARVVISFTLLDEQRTLSEELLIVSTMLGGIVGLYFSGLAITDPKYRPEQFDREVVGVREILAVRAVYLEALRSDAPAS